MASAEKVEELVLSYEEYCRMFKMCKQCPYHNTIHCRMAYAYDKGLADGKESNNNGSNRKI